MRVSEDELNQLIKNGNVKIHGKKPEPTGVILIDEEKRKYKNKRTTVDGTTYDSKKESETYGELELLLKAGEIAGYCRQPEFIVQPGTVDVKPIKYTPDWIIFYPDGTYIIREDKGMETEAFRLRLKLFKGRFPKLKYEIVR